MNDGYKGSDFEWWYFHFISDIKFNIIVHPTDMYGMSKTSYVSISMFEGIGRSYNFKQIFNLKNTDILNNKLCIKNNIFCIEEIEDNIAIELSLEDIKAKINIYKIISPEPFNENYTVLDNKNENLYNNWMLVVPHSMFYGTLYYLGKSIQLKGYAYHDHNWGNLLIHKCYNYWLWGNFQNANYSITYYYLIGVNGEQIKLLNVILENKSTNLTDFHIVDLKSTIEIVFNIGESKYILSVNSHSEFKSHIKRLDKNMIYYSRYASLAKLHNYIDKTVIYLDGINERLNKEKI